MEKIKYKHAQTIFLGVLVVQLLIPLANISLFQRYYRYPSRVIYYHMSIVLLGYIVPLAIIYLLGSWRTARSWKASGYVLPLTWASCTVLLYSIYSFTWVGSMIMGINVTPEMLVPYVLHPSLALNAGTLSCMELSVMTAILIAIFLVYIAAARPLAAVLLRWHFWMRRTKRKPLPRVYRFRFWAAATGLVLLEIEVACIYPPLSAGSLLGDPIFTSSGGENAVLPIYKLGTANDADRRAYVPPSTFQKMNVILIVIDDCRADHLGVMGYSRNTTPFLSSLQRTGHLRLAKSFYSASCCTFGGVLTLLRSQYWFNMALHAFALQDVLKKAGYSVHFILSGDFANFFNMKLYCGSSIDSYSDGRSAERHCTVNDDRGLFETLDRVAPYDGTPSFLYFHLMSVHQLGLRLPQNAKYQPAEFEKTPAHYRNYYDNGIVQADDNLRNLFGRLEQKGYLQNSLVVITSDHGESMGERGLYGHTHNLYAEEITPPLMIYDPDPALYPGLSFAQQVDVAPTILDRLGLPIPSSWNGHSLLRDEPQRFSYLRLGDLYGVIDHTSARTLKYIYNDASKKEELYDETHDPHDQRDIFSSADADEIGELRDAVGAFSVHPIPGSQVLSATASRDRPNAERFKSLQ